MGAPSLCAARRLRLGIFPATGRRSRARRVSRGCGRRPRSGGRSPLAIARVGRGARPTNPAVRWSLGNVMRLASRLTLLAALFLGGCAGAPVETGPIDARIERQVAAAHVDPAAAAAAITAYRAS